VVLWLFLEHWFLRLEGSVQEVLLYNPRFILGQSILVPRSYFRES
jgi:hypothetical protein